MKIVIFVCSRVIYTYYLRNFTLKTKIQTLGCQMYPQLAKLRSQEMGSATGIIPSMGRHVHVAYKSPMLLLLSKPDILEECHTLVLYVHALLIRA